MTTEYFLKGLPQAALTRNDNIWIMLWTYTYGQVLFKTGREILAQMRMAKLITVGMMLCIKHNQCLSHLPYKFWSWCGPPGSGHFFTWCTGQRNVLGIFYHFLLICLMSYVWKHRDLSPINKQLNMKALQNKPRKQTLFPGNATISY